MESNDTKKSNLDDLTKEELIKKVTQLLQLAQKAKQSKISLQEENNKLKEELKSNLSYVSQELIDELTLQKLNLVSSNEDLKTKNKVIQNELKDLQEKLTVCDNENTSYKRQINRLTDENEQLISDLDVLEKQLEKLKEIGANQQQQLLELERGKKEETENATNELQKMLHISLEEIKRVNNESNDLRDKVQKFEERDNKFTELEDNNVKLKQKIKFYHSKIIKFANIAKELRSSKNEILELFKSYLDQVKNWKEQLHLVEKNIASIEEENRKLKEKLLEIDEMKFKHLETQKNDFEKKISTLKEEHKKMYEENIQWEKQSQELQNELKIIKDQYESEKFNLEKELSILKVEKIDNKEIFEERSLHWVKESEKLQEELKLLKDHYEMKLEHLETQKNDFEKKISTLKEEHKKMYEENIQWEKQSQELQNELKIIKDQYESEKLNLEKELSNLKVEKIENKEIFEERSLHWVKESEKLQEELKLLKDQYESEKSSWHKELNNLKVDKTEGREILEEKSLYWEKESKKLQNELKTRESEKLTIINEKENELQLLRNENIKISKIKQDLIEELEKLNTDKKSLTKTVLDLQNEVRTLQEFETRSLEEIKLLAEENRSLITSNEELEEKIQKNRYSMQTSCNISSNSKDLDEQISNLKRENTELLSEMNEMNQAIKERGENISKLEAHCEEILKKLQIYETQANKNIDNLSEKEKMIEELTKEIEKLKYNGIIYETEANKNIDNLSQKEQIIEDLNKEIEKLKYNKQYKNEIELLKSEIEVLKEKLDSSYMDDGMSTSTISRNEEISRLKDLEGSWEERYGKLRNLAVKLKGKVRDLTQNLTQQQLENEENQKKLTSNIKTIQNLENQIFKLEDDLEKSKNECTLLQNQISGVANDISRDKQNLANTEEIIASLKMELENSKKEKHTTDTWKKQVGAKIQTLRKELEANNVLKKDYEAKINTLNHSLEAKEIALKTEVENHKYTKTLLEQSQNECKKTSVLSLEMQDYERGAKESTKKLEKQQEEISNLKIQIENQKTTIAALREQNKILEERILTEENNQTSLTTEMSTYKKQVTNLENEVSQKIEKIHILTHQLETSRLETEELSTELGKLISEHQKTITNLKSEREILTTENLRLQQSLREAQDILKLNRDELKVIQKEYEGYKVRAQSVLRQNQSRDVGQEEKLSEEVAALVAQNLKLTNEIEETKKTIESLETINQKLTTDLKDHIQKIRELEEDSEEIKTQFADLSVKHEKTVIENAETFRNLKVHADTLSQCYRQQLADQESRHSRDLLELRSRLELAPTSTETSPILPTMARGEGEGSESIGSNGSSGVHPVPLERLLGTNSEQDIERIKKKLQDNELKVTHLTSLLSDTEQDLVKHVQMNKLLKEEIRRQQRSEEREKHAENLEYLKNVVFKFVTLNNGDERSRLVPVLNTILKLSPEETKHLNLVAVGGAAGLKGWSSYLPTWSSPNKSQ